MSDVHEIEHLKAEHAALETALQDEETKPHPDHMMLAAIKKKKLHIKDQIARLEHV